MNLGIVYINMLIIAFVFAYFLSNYITQSLTRISQRIKTTKLNEENAKIDIEKKISNENCEKIIKVFNFFGAFNFNNKYIIFKLYIVK